jgi:hypothetical protein
MADENRKHSRLEKTLTIHFCLLEEFSKRWDIATIINISAGGVKFKALNDLELNDKIIQLRIRVPELAPQCLEVEAMVLDNQNSLIRAKFINLTEENKEHLLVVEKMVNRLLK